MSRALSALIVLSTAFAQNRSDLFEKAPPDIDEALRGTITKFYQAHVDGKFRQADEFVAADTKDFYYNANKPRYLSFEIGKIVYSDNFTKAKAIVVCEQRIMAPGFADKPMKVPAPSLWKIENGQWRWWVDQEALKVTPFGVMSPGGGQSGPTAPSLAAGPSVEALMKGVKADKESVQLSAKKASSEDVTISNGLAGNVVLALESPKIPGLTVSLDRTELRAGEQAKLTIKSAPQEKQKPMPARVLVRVQQTNQLIPIQVSID